MKSSQRTPLTGYRPCYICPLAQEWPFCFTKWVLEGHVTVNKSKDDGCILTIFFYALASREMPSPPISVSSSFCKFLLYSYHHSYQQKCIHSNNLTNIEPSMFRWCAWVYVCLGPSVVSNLLVYHLWVSFNPTANSMLKWFATDCARFKPLLAFFLIVGWISSLDRRITSANSGSSLVRPWPGVPIAILDVDALAKTVSEGVVAWIASLATGDWFPFFDYW